MKEVALIVILTFIIKGFIVVLIGIHMGLLDISYEHAAITIILLLISQNIATKLFRVWRK